MTEKTTKRLEETLTKPAPNPEKLKKQQEYYSRLKKDGVTKKQAYSLKSVAAIW